MNTYIISSFSEVGCVNNLSNRLLNAVMQAREFLNKLGDLSQTQIFAKIENMEVWYSSIFSLESKISKESPEFLCFCIRD